MCLGIVLPYAILICGALHCAASLQTGGQGYTGQVPHPFGGLVVVISEALGCHCTPVNGAVSMSPGPTNQNCTPILFVRLCRIRVPGRCAEPLNASRRLPRLSALGDQWAAICPAVRPGRSLLVGPHLCAQPVATLHVCSTPHVGGSYTAGYTHQRTPPPPTEHCCCDRKPGGCNPNQAGIRISLGRDLGFGCCWTEYLQFLIEIDCT